MKYIDLYHGSDKIISFPTYGFGNVHNDYGLGFYCTEDIELAKEWANKNIEHGIVNHYHLDLDGLTILDLTDKSKYHILNWLAVLLRYREIGPLNQKIFAKELAFIDKYYIDIRKFDVVIGYRADDAYFAFPLAFLNNEISINSLEKIYALGELGTQIVLISRRAFDAIEFKDSIVVDSLFNKKYQNRKEEAVSKYLKIKSENKFDKGDRIIDLMNKHD